MLSPDPFMGADGYPLLLATGETADGRTPLVDRQHPHDLVSEVSVSLSHKFTDRLSGFVYLGLPGEPAFGPPAFMHRLSIMDSPEAPISHHWLDSTHISEGVVTAGVVLGGVKFEASRFRGREPADQVERTAQGGARLQTAQPGGLDARPVRHRVGERHADLDQVGARAGHAAQDGERGGAIGVVGLEERDQRAAPLGLERGKLRSDAAHNSTPRCAATEKMSLSPRPHMFIRMMASLGSVGASFCT